MNNKTRKHIWPGALVLSLAIVGVLAAFAVLAGNPVTTDAHDGGSAGSHCTGESETFQSAHDALAPSDHPKCADDADGTPPALNGDGDGNGNGEANGGMMGAAMHATMPMYFDLEGLDNGARLDWDAPKDVADDAEVVGYLIHRDAWNADLDHPINEGGDAYIHVYEAQ